MEQEQNRWKIREKILQFFEKYNPAGPAKREGDFLKRPETVLFIIYALLTFLMVFFHETWRDEAQGFLIVRDLSLPQLFAQLHREVHFPVWYLLILPFVKLGIPVYGVNIIHWILALVLVWLILEKFPFRLLTRSVLVFSFPLFFEFSVIARNYTIGFLLLTIVFLLWKKLWERPVFTAFLLALCLLCDPFFVGIVSGLCICIFFQAITQNRLKSREFILSVIIVSAAIVLDLILVCGFSSGSFSVPHPVEHAVSPVGNNILQRLWRPFSIISSLFGMSPVIMILLFFLTIFQLRHSREGVFIFVFSSLFTYVAFVLGGFDSMRHAAFFPAGGVAAFLIAGRGNVLVNKKLPEKSVTVLFFIFILWSAVFLLARSVSAFRNEILYDFSHGKYTADFINKNLPSSTVYCTAPVYYTPVFASLQHKRIFSLSMEKYITFSPWISLRSPDLSRIPETVLKHLPANEDHALYVSMIYDLPSKQAENMYLLYSSLNERAGAWAHPEECYWVFLIVRPEKAHLFKDKFPLYDPSNYVLDK